MKGTDVKNISMLSTRHTKIGTLRRGIVYRLNEENQDAAKVIANLTKTKACEVLTDAAVKKRNSKVESLVKKQAPAKGAGDKAIKLAEKAVSDAEGERDKALKEAEDLTSERDKALKEAEDLTSERDKAQEQVKELTAKLETAERAATASAAK